MGAGAKSDPTRVQIRYARPFRMPLAETNTRPMALLAATYRTPRMTLWRGLCGGVSGWTESWKESRESIFVSAAPQRLLCMLSLGVLNLRVVYSTELPGDVKLLPLPEEEFQKGDVHELGPFDDFRVRILPVLGEVLHPTCFLALG